jgi:sporulation integral membrane protein YlbJ
MMLPHKLNVQSPSATMLLGGLAALLVICIIIYPNAVFQSSLNGMMLWWKIVFPALLPFLILSEITIGAGAVHALGIVLDPLIRLLFRVEGSGGWPLGMGLLAGFPAGADITSKLRHNNMLQPAEAERILAISHLCNPAVMITIIGVGFFQQASVGILILIVHYMSALLMGMMMSWRSSAADKQALRRTAVMSHTAAHEPHIIVRALHKAKQAQLEDGRTFGKILGDAVINAIQTLMLIGGWMMFFAVLNQVILLLLPINLSQGTTAMIIAGFLEPHLGTYAIAQSEANSMLIKAAFIGAVLGWSGLSLHAQVKSLVQSTDIRFWPFIKARLLHAALAFILTALLWKPFNLSYHYFHPSDKPSYADGTQTISPMHFIRFWPHLESYFLGLLLIFVVLLICAASISIAIEHIQKRLRRR